MKIQRLLQMSAAEIAHRLREKSRRNADRLRFRSPHQLDDDPELDELISRHGSSVKTYLMHGPAGRFYESTHDRDGVIRCFSSQFPEWLDRAVQQAAALRERRVDLLAFPDVRIGDNIDWHRDPISGFQWPRRFCADYDLVHAPPADVKIIHELNRCQHLPRLAKAFFLTGEEIYAQEAVSQLECWIMQNPKWDGVNWQSSLELAIRCISWLWTIFLLLPSTALDEEHLRRICRSLFAQLDHVYRYPSTYTSPNTHLIGEAAALFIAGTLFSELPRARQWREFGSLALVREMDRQVSRDGVHRELSSYYHCYAADFYIQVAALARRNRAELPEWVWQRMERMIEFVMVVTRPDGTIPLLGDDDGGRVLAMSAGNYSSFRDGLCSGAVLFRRPDFKSQAGAFCEESLWLFGPESWSVFDGIQPERPANSSYAFEDAGYVVQRSGWNARDTHVTFDCGGLGLGSGGHAHADALSLTAFSDGHPFLIDPGTSVYNGRPEWRRFFRSTAAHNTVIVDGKSQAEPGETFRWKTRQSSRLRGHFSLFGLDYVDASVEFRDGLKAEGLEHRRRLIHVQPNYWIVLDVLAGIGRHHCDFLYHFSSEALLAVLSDEKRGEIECRAGIGHSRFEMFMYASDAVRAEAICGQNEPIQGWTSDLYGECRPSPVLKASVSSLAPISMMSLLVPGHEPAHVRRFKANTNHAIAASIQDNDYDDIAVMAVEDGDLQILDCSMRGEFFWLRLEAGRIRRVVAVNTYSFRYAGEVVFDSQTMIPWVHVCFWDNGILIERGDGEGKIYVRNLRDRQFQRH